MNNKFFYCSNDVSKLSNTSLHQKIQISICHSKWLKIMWCSCKSCQSGEFGTDGLVTVYDYHQNWYQIIGPLNAVPSISLKTPWWHSMALPSNALIQDYTLSENGRATPKYIVKKVVGLQHRPTCVCTTVESIVQQWPKVQLLLSCKLSMKVFNVIFNTR